MRKFLFALVIIATGSNATLAADVAIEDILGRWCVSDSGNFNTFSQTQLLVESPKGWKRTFGISKIEVNKDQITFYWTPYKSGSSTAYKLSDDKRTLIQLPNVDENGKAIGDKGPRRELHRC